jgi:hypothetical protein
VASTILSFSICYRNYVPAPKRILVLAATASEAARLRAAADKLALELVLGCSDHTGTVSLNFHTRDSALHIVEYVHQNPIAAIIPVGDETAPSAARAASIVGLPFHSPKAADICAIPKPFAKRNVEDPGFTLECLMTSGKLRVLAVQQGLSTTPLVFTALPPGVQKSIVEAFKNVAAKLALRHGPVRVHLVNVGGEISILKVSLCYADTPFTEALNFRIPLVDQQISYAELVIRNALDLDISRIVLAPE